MPLFMFLGGYVASMNIDGNISNISIFIKKKIVQLIIPFTLWGGVTIVYLSHNKINVETIVNLFLYPDNGPWFLIVMFSIQIWYIFLITFSRKIPIIKAGFISDVVAFAMFIVPIFVLSRMNTLCSNLYISPVYYTMFFAGHYTARYFQKLMSNEYITVLALMLFLILFPNFHMWENNSMLLILSISICATVLVLRISFAMEKMVSPMINRLASFGQASLVIYVTHYFFIKVISIEPFLLEGIHPIPLLLILMIFAILVSQVCVYISELVSYMSILNIILYGRKSPKRP